MSYRPSAPLEFLLALLALLAAWALIASSAPFPAGLAAFATALVALATVPDVLDLLLRLYRTSRVSRGTRERRRLPTASIEVDSPDLTASRKRLHLKPWAVVLSVHNLSGEIQDFLETLEPFSDVAWVIDDASSDHTPELLESAGIRCVPSVVNRHKPGALRHLLSRLPQEIETVLVMDPDTRILSDRSTLESLVFDFQRSSRAALTPRIDVRKDGLVASLQRLEYFMALGLGRKSLGDLAVCSGICFYRRADLVSALDEHSLSVYAEDLETSLILLGSGRKCYFDETAHFETEGMTTWAGLFSQRAGWSYGLLRVYASRLGDIRRIAGRGAFAFYQFVVYLGGACILAQPLRIVALGLVLASLLEGVADLAGINGWTPGLVDPSQFLVFYGVYLLIAACGWLLAVPKTERAALAAVVPLYGFYAMFLIVPSSIGYLNWLWLRLAGRRLYHDHYENEASLLQGLAQSKRPSS